MKHYHKGKVGECSSVWQPEVQQMEARFQGNAYPWKSTQNESSPHTSPLFSSRKRGETEQSTFCSLFQKCMLLQVDTYEPDESPAFQERDRKGARSCKQALSREGKQLHWLPLIMNDKTLQKNCFHDLYRLFL